MNSQKQRNGHKKQEKKKRLPIVKLIIFVACVIVICIVGVKLLHIDDNGNFSASSSCLTSNLITCLSTDCIKTTNDISSSIDPSLDPCQDFYQFSCGNFHKKFGQLLPQPFQEAQKFRDLLATIIKESISDDDWQPLVSQKKIYQACMNTNTTENSTHILFLLNDVGGWPMVIGNKWKTQDESAENQFYWKKTMMLCRKKGLPFEWFLTFFIDYNQHVIITSPESEAYDNFDDIVYKSLMEEVAVSLGASREMAHKEITDVVAFRNKLKALHGKLKTNSLVYKPLGSIKWISFPIIRWAKVLNELSISLRKFDENYHVFVNEHYLDGLGNLLAKTSIRTQANYIAWKVVEEFGLFLPGPVRNIFEKYSLYQNKNLKNRDDICIEFAKLRFPHVVEATYVQRYVTREDEEEVTEIVENIKNEYKNSISDNLWIDDLSKEYAIKQLDNLKSVIGFTSLLSSTYNTSRMLQWEGFAMRDSNIIDMLRQYNLWIRWQMKPFDRGHNMERILRLASKVNAYYLLTTNTLVIPPAMLQGSIFDKSRPNFLNYAVLGMSIAHEIAHGFNPDAIVIINETSSFSIWQNTTYDAIEEIFDCIKIQYRNWESDKLLTYHNVQEHFSDLIGIQKAYQAYVKTQNVGSTESQLPGLDFTPQQMFWIKYATFMCQPEDKNEFIYSSSEHGHSRHRINLALRNYKTFPEVFNCPLGTPMNPQEKCRIF